MAHPIVIAHHLVITAYGWWLPNDPRGSTSRTVACDVLRELGELHFGRKKIQPPSHHIRSFYASAKEKLVHDLVEFSHNDLRIIADAFARTIGEQTYTCWACALMSDHVHLLIRKHKHTYEEMLDQFQRTSRIALVEAGLRAQDHPVWATSGWSVFLEHPDEVRRTIRYIENNPLKMRRPVQRYAFVKIYDGWPLHPGHSPNSPYAKRLRGWRAP